MNKIQIFVILANSILFSILNYPDEIAITYITIISFCIWMFCLKKIKKSFENGITFLKNLDNIARNDSLF